MVLGRRQPRRRRWRRGNLYVSVNSGRGPGDPRCSFSVLLFDELSPYPKEENCKGVAESGEEKTQRSQAGRVPMNSSSRIEVELLPLLGAMVPAATVLTQQQYGPGSPCLSWGIWYFCVLRLQRSPQTKPENCL
ncbi:uncharacterized protein LOC111071601 [Drosophila obscura]|uniref:uncharacterized protein LOC111071601 n=1 Tax=Drosophila obscura TaxID=7282 RepID=UPI001BB26A42|nr:uncharacterized protein LOC111071601 [Drosophila obscura]